MSQVTVVGQEAIQQRSTRAAAEFVAATRLQLRAELMRDGESARQTRRFRRLADGIRPESLRAFWPDADIEAALGRTDDPAHAPEIAPAPADERGAGGHHLIAV